MATPRSALKQRSLSPRTKDTLDDQATPSRTSLQSSSLSPPYKSLSVVTHSSSAADTNGNVEKKDAENGSPGSGTGLASRESRTTTPSGRKAHSKYNTLSPSTVASSSSQPPPFASASGTATTNLSSSTPEPENGTNPVTPNPSNETDEQRIDRVRRLLEYRQENARYFDNARIVGPQVFTDTVPLLGNSLLVILFGNIVVNAPSIGIVQPVTNKPASLVASASTFEYNDVPGACGTVPTLRIYVQGLIIAAYIFCGILGWYTLRTQVTTHIRWPFLLVSAWCGGIGAWTFFGIGAVTEAVKADCITTSPFLFGLAVTELVLCPLFAGSVILKWFASAIWRNLFAFIDWCRRSYRKWQEKRSRNQSTVT